MRRPGPRATTRLNRLYYNNGPFPGKGVKGGFEVASPADSPVGARPSGTVRRGPNWGAPLFTVVALGGFAVYAAWEGFAHNTGTYGNYVSPLFSPDVAGWFGFHTLTALWVMWIPFFFRATCYYYRKEYYRAFFFHPVACAVPEPGRGSRSYSGETRWPWALNNFHRYFWYLAVVVMVFLWKDTVEAFIFPNGFGVGIGSLIILANTLLLTFYTFSCHAFRNLVGGRRDCFSCSAGSRMAYGWWRRVSAWNRLHGTWAWASLFSVWATDVYIRLLINGVIHDVRLF